MEKPGLSLPSVELPANIHADEPTDVDKLDRQTFADAFANLAVSCETPLVIGIHGTWGTGKSSFMKMIRKNLKETHRDDVHTVWFDPWMHQFDDNPIIAFAHALAASIKKPITKEIKKLLTVTAVAFGSGILNRLLGVGAKDVKELGDLYEEERFQIQESRSKLREHFEELTNKIKTTTGKRRLIFFIDDLDRCRPENALKLLEALKLYLNIKKCVYFLGVDHAALELIIKETSRGTDQHEAKYLDKIVQLPFHIPPIDLEKGMKEYVDELVKAEHLEPCKEMLIHCLGGNPRQVKRFINTLTLNDLLAKTILEEYDPEILTFVLLIQLLRHDLFQRLLPDYNLLKKVADAGGKKEEVWEEDVKKFYDDHFATDERLRTALTMVGRLPEKEVLERYLYLTKAAGISNDFRTKEDNKLERILDDHEAWVATGGNEGKRAVLTHAQLNGANLQGACLEQAVLLQAQLNEADLRAANLKQVNLHQAHLVKTKLSGANLDDADLRQAHLTEANLNNASLIRANLKQAHLNEAELRMAVLSESDLSQAHLLGAKVCFSHLINANLSQTELGGADLREADLRGVKGLHVTQLAQAKTLYEAKLDPELEAELQKKHPHLFEPPEDEKPPEDM